MMVSAVDRIKEQVAMRDVLWKYGFEPKKRMRCPLHNGKDENFVFNDHTYMCFSHCGGGDIITFVQKLFGIGFREAIKRLDEDFNLMLFSKPSLATYRRNRMELEKKKAEQRRKQIDDMVAEMEYWEIFGNWLELDRDYWLYRPKNSAEEMHPKFINALQKLAYKKYLLQMAEIERLKR